MRGDEFNRRKEGEQHVELLCPLNEYKLKYIEQFRKEHPNTSTEWFNHRFNEKISLDEIVELLDGIPNLEEHVTVLSEGCITYYPIGKDPIQSFRNAILEQVPCESSEKGPLFLKKDVIEWMQKKATTDQIFIFRLNSDFVEDYMQLHSTKILENEKISKEDFFKLLAKEILEDIAFINLEEMWNMPFVIRGCLNFCGFELNKNKNTYDKDGRLIPRLSRDTLRGYLKDLNIPAVKQGNLSQTYKANVEKWLVWLKKERFNSDKYRIHKSRLEKLIKQGVFN